MKKPFRLKILFIGILLILLSACSKESTEASKDTSECFERSFYVRLTGMVSEEKCFPEATGGVLKLYSSQTQKANIFCFDPTCTHRAPSMGTSSSCFAWNHNVTDSMPMLSNKNLYFYEKESFMKSKLIKADKDTKNQKTIVEFDGNVVQALCDEDTIISLVEDEYEFNFDGEFEKKEKKKIIVYATNVTDGRTTKLFEDEQFGNQIVSSCFVNGRFNFVYYALDMSEVEMNEMYEKYGTDGFEEITEQLLGKTTNEIISIDVKDNKTVYRKKVNNNYVASAVSEKYCAFTYMAEEPGENAKGRTITYNIEKDTQNEIELSGPEIFECGSGFLIRGGVCDLTLFDAESGKVLKEQSYDSSVNIKAICGNSVYYITGHDDTDLAANVIALDDLMAGGMEKAVKIE